MPAVRYLSVALLLMAALPASGAGATTQRQEFVEVRGAPPYVQIRNGKPVVLLHGALHHFDNSFGKQRDEFARSRAVIGIGHNLAILQFLHAPPN